MYPVYNVSSAAKHLSLSQGPVTKGNFWFNIALFSCLSPHSVDYLDHDELNFCIYSYSVLLQGVKFQNGTAIFDRYAGVEFFGEHYGSLDSTSERSPYIIAPWMGINGNINPTSCFFSNALLIHKNTTITKKKNVNHANTYSKAIK